MPPKRKRSRVTKAAEPTESQPKRSAPSKDLEIVDTIQIAIQAAIPGITKAVMDEISKQQTSTDTAIMPSPSAPEGEAANDSAVEPTVNLGPGISGPMYKYGPSAISSSPNNANTLKDIATAILKNSLAPTVQNLHGKVLCERVTDLIAQTSPLHCALTPTPNQKYLLAVYDVLMEFYLEESSVKTLYEEPYWKYVDISCTYTGFLLTVQEKKRRGHQREYRISRCDYSGRVLQVIKFDRNFVIDPFKIQEDLRGDIWLIDKSAGSLRILDPAGKSEGTYLARDMGKPRLLLCDRFGNTVVYSSGSQAIHFIGENLSETQPIKLRKTVIRSLCCDNEGRLICLCDSGEEEFEIQTFTYLQ